MTFTPVAPFVGDFANSTKAWSAVQGADDSVKVIAAPWSHAAAHGRDSSGPVNAVRFQVDDNDPAEVSTLHRNINRHNPAACVIGPGGAFREGSAAYMSWQVFIPSAFPALQPMHPTATSPWTWAFLGELHGNYAGSPRTALNMSLVNGVEVLSMTSMTPHYRELWTTPLRRDVPIKVAFHIGFSANPAIAYREVFLADPTGLMKLQVLTNGSTRFVNDATLNVDLNAGQSEPLSFYAQLYCRRGSYTRSGPVSIIQGTAKFGPTLASV